MEDRRCKLGLQGRRELMSLIEQGSTLRRAAPRLSVRDTLTELGAHHIRIPPYTSRWNGKIERFFGTLDTEWAHSRVWPNSAARDRALSSFMRYYNRRRPHTAAGRPSPAFSTSADSTPSGVAARP